MATVTVPAVTANVADVAPWETVTLDGRLAPAGEELKPMLTPPERAAELRPTVQVDSVEGPIEVGLQAKLLKCGVWSMVTTPGLRERGIDAPVLLAAEPPVSWTDDDGSGALFARLSVTVARTPFGSVVVFNPQATQVELPVPVVQETVLPEAPEPGVTTADEKSVVE